MEKAKKMAIRAVVLTISDSASRGEREDLSGPAVVEELGKLGAVIVGTMILADIEGEIARQLRHYADSGEVDLVVTAGGTGFAGRDVTPEATRQVIEREAPGLAELMRADSVRGARENLQAIARLLPHAISLLRE
jgi:molybdenum cofactor synthesis domain-containing protein